MNTLNLGSDDEPVVKKKSNTRNLKIALGLAAVILIPTIGSTLAGSIVINTGTGVEFGQGISATAACGALTLTPTSVFTNAENAGAFTLDTVTVSSIPSACSGKKFTIKAYDSSTATALILSTRTGSALIVTPTFSGNSCTSVAVLASGNETATCTASGSIANVVIAVVSRPAADTVYKFTVESS
jgi:hypothetical protein